MIDLIEAGGDVMTCEKCWAEAYRWGFVDQAEEYSRLVLERKDHPCSPREQAGQWWDEEKQRDSRLDIKRDQDDE